MSQDETELLAFDKRRGQKEKPKKSSFGRRKPEPAKEEAPASPPGTFFKASALAPQEPEAATASTDNGHRSFFKAPKEEAPKKAAKRPRAEEPAKEAAPAEEAPPGTFFKPKKAEKKSGFGFRR